MLLLTLEEGIWKVFNNRIAVPPRCSPYQTTGANARYVTSLSLSRECKQKNLQNYIHEQHYFEDIKFEYLYNFWLSIL